MQKSLLETEKQQVTYDTLVKRYPNKFKENMLPKIGTQFSLGRVLFQVNHINTGKLRFSARVVGVIKKETGAPVVE